MIQGTSAAAQSWSPEYGDTINKVFDVSSLKLYIVYQFISLILNPHNYQQIPVQTLQAVGNLVKDRFPQQSNSQISQIRREQRQTRIREQQLQQQRQQNDDYASRRHHHHSYYNAWQSVVTDFLVGSHGHGGLLGGHGNFWGGHGSNLGHKNNKNKKKIKKKGQHGLGNHGIHFGGHFGSHGQGMKYKNK